MTVTVPTDPAHRSAEEIGRTAAGPRPLPPLGPTREVPLPDVLDVTLANGLRVLVARNPRVPMAELRLRVPFGPDATETDDAAVSRHLAAAELLTATLLTGTSTRDRVGIDDELAGVGADLGVGVDPERLQIGGSGLAAGLPTILDVLDAQIRLTQSEADLVQARYAARLTNSISCARGVSSPPRSQSTPAN